MAEQSITCIWQYNAASGFFVKIPDDRSLVAIHHEIAVEWYPRQDDLKAPCLNACSQVVMER